MSTFTEAGGRPSNARIKHRCIHYLTDQVAADNSPHVGWGNKVDPWIKRLVDGAPLGSWTLQEAPEVAAAEWVVAAAKKVLTGIQTQKRMHLVDLFVSPPEVITPGTADIVGYNEEEELWEVWDCKSGRQHDDYDWQLMFYALMLMDELGEVEIRIRVAYCDLKLFQEAIVTRADCEERIFGLVERIRIGVELPQENEYCGQCARQSVCEVWTKPAEIAFSIMDIADTQPLVDMSPVLDQTLRVQNRLEMIKADPKMLGRFIDAWRKAEKLVEKSGVEDAAKELLIAGKEVPGWRALECEGRAFYNKEQIEAILQEWGESAADFLSVNRERYEGACANSDNEIIQPEGRSKSFYKLLKKK
jgi:hypothetical protein